VIAAPKWPEQSSGEIAAQGAAGNRIVARCRNAGSAAPPCSPRKLPRWLALRLTRDKPARSRLDVKCHAA
jgi:hypothetical protein